MLVGERLAAVAEAREIGVASYRKTKQNLAIAFLFNGIGVPAAITGFVHPVWAMVAMISSVSTVLLNSFGARLRPALIYALPGLARRGLGAFAPLVQVENLRLLRDRRLAAVLALVAAAFALGTIWVVGLGQQQNAMGAPAQPQAAKGSLPAVTGFYGGAEVRFAHTEASSAKVAKLLTRMTGSPVLVVRSSPTSRARRSQTCTSSRTASRAAGRWASSPTSSTASRAHAATPRCGRSTS